MIYHT